MTELPTRPLSFTSPSDQGSEDMMIMMKMEEMDLDLDICMVRRKMLLRLRQLVVRSIGQVRRCLQPMSRMPVRLGSKI